MLQRSEGHSKRLQEALALAPTGNAVPAGPTPTPSPAHLKKTCWLRMLLVVPAQWLVCTLGFGIFSFISFMSFIS